MTTTLILKILSVISLSSVKFLFAAPTSIALGFSFIETVILCIIGGSLGVLVFTFSSKYVYKIIDFTTKPFRSKKKISKKKNGNQLAEKIAKKYGLVGLSIVTPSIISIPIGTLLAIKLFPDKKKVISFLIFSVIIWALILASAGDYLVDYFDL